MRISILRNLNVNVVGSDITSDNMATDADNVTVDTLTREGYVAKKEKPNPVLDNWRRVLSIRPSDRPAG